MSSKQCQAKTTKGTQCQNDAQGDSDYCYIKSHCAENEDPEHTDKQQRFIEEYCVDANATEAAVRAGYSRKTAGQIGYQLLQKTSISEAITERMDRLSMSAEEAIKKLSDWGRGTAHPFLVWDDSTGTYKIDLSTEEAQRNLHLIKKLKQNETVMQKGSDDKPEVLGRTFEIELHDAKDAVKQIGKVHGIYAPEEIKDVSDKPKRLVLIDKGGSDG